MWLIFVISSLLSCLGSGLKQIEPYLLAVNFKLPLQFLYCSTFICGGNKLLMYLYIFLCFIFLFIYKDQGVVGYKCVDHYFMTYMQYQVLQFERGNRIYLFLFESRWRTVILIYKYIVRGQFWNFFATPPKGIVCHFHLAKLFGRVLVERTLQRMR